MDVTEHPDQQPTDEQPAGELPLPDPDAAGTPAATGRGSFSVDIAPRTIAGAVREFYSRLRAGDPGGLPSVLGLIVLGVIFWLTTANFVSLSNLVFLLQQGSFTMLFALGLIFVLLIGEIDLSAGTTGGLCAAFAAQWLSSSDAHKTVGSSVFYILLVALLGALALAVWNRLWAPAVLSVIGVVLTLTNGFTNQWLAFLFALCIGVSIGVITGVLVARVGIPSFVVTLALFLAWQGVELFALNSQSIGTTNFNYWFDLTHGTMAVWAGWVLFVLIAGGYLVFTFVRSRMRARAGVSHDTVSLVLARAGVLLVLGFVITFALNSHRSTGAGVPWAASVPLILMVLLTLVLSKTTWGRHLFAIGGNAEAARRAGIPVERIKVSAFAVCSGLAALGGLFLADQSGGAQTGLGQGDVLLFAVAAAVIGGTSLFGGRGRPRDAIVGALVISIIPNGIQLHQMPPETNEVITGVVLLVAATVDAISRRRSATRR